MSKQINFSGSLLFFVMTLALTSTRGLPSQAVQSPDGTVSFESAVLLVDTYATFSTIRFRQARYYFDLELPEGIGEPLKKVVIQQRRGSEEIDFRSEVTIGVKPRRNPDFGGVYLFGVTAFPAGEKSRGLYLGAGRLHFFENFNSSSRHILDSQQENVPEWRINPKQE